MLSLIVANGFLACTFTLTKFLLHFFPPFYIAAFRCLGSGFLSAGLLFSARNKKLIPVFKNRKMAFMFARVVLFSTIVVYSCESWALQYVTTTKVTLIYSSSLFIMALYSYYYFDELLTLKKWLGLCMGFTGVVLVLVSDSPSEELIIAFGKISWPELALLVGIASECYGWVYQRILMREHHVSYVQMDSLAWLAGGFFMLAVALKTEPIGVLYEPWRAFGFLGLLIIGAFFAGSWISSLFSYYSLTILSFAGLLLPVFTGILGYLFLGEKISYAMIISMLLISSGMYIFYQEELRQNNILF
ncbi:MAG: DMT family transporter [Candidatus Babeliales bacterium]